MPYSRVQQPRFYVNYFEFLCILKNLLGKDFPIKEHDVDNAFLKKESNIFDNSAIFETEAVPLNTSICAIREDIAPPTT